MADHCFIKVLENSHVSPPPGSVPTTSLSLTYFDTIWISCFHMKRLFFYEFPYQTSHFIQNILPNLKTSLSLALQQFFPFAGHLVLPQLPQRPYIHYESGDDFVPFVVAESTPPAEFNHLIGRDHVPLRVEELKRFVPELPSPPPPPSNGNGACKKQPLMAIQVTIFPNVGVSIGVTFSHIAADGRAFAHFTKSWAAICKSKGDSTFVNISPPDYRRDLIQDPNGIWSIFLKFLNESKTRIMNISAPDVVRLSPVLTKPHVETLKNRVALKFVEENEKEEPRLSTFVVTIAFIWVCLIILYAYQSNNKSHDIHGTYVLVFQADCRDRLSLPANYFGNCLKPIVVAVKASEMGVRNGVLAAAKAIGNEIKGFEKEPLKGVESWLWRAREVFSEGQYYVTIAGSPKLRVYETDFGFGRPVKSDVVHIVSQSSISMAETRDEEGGVELGLALPLAEVDKFNAIFEQGLLNLS